MKRVRLTMIEQRGKCEHKPGDAFVYPEGYEAPEGLCPGIAGPIAPYVKKCAAGEPSWEENDPDHWYLSCLSKRGTVWKLERVE